ncbi:MAG: META domain-containing protein [Muribaculaceae bacterium]|nr:META domain-containing protein [Muribaculaceae bacterium]
MKHSNSIIAAAALAITATGCSIFSPKPTVNVNKSTGEVKTESATETVAAIDKILYGEWTVANVNGQAVTGDDRPYVVFDTTSVNPFRLKVYANNGCNTINGDMSVTPGGDMHKASEFLSTMMYCADAPYEIGINMAFETVKSFNIEKIGNDYLLYMKNSAGNPLMILRKSDISFVNGAWTVTKIGNEDVAEDKGVKLVIDVPELRVHGNTGCNILNGNIFVDPDKQNSLQFKDLATTRMMCPDIENEQKFLVALEQVETVVPGPDGTTALLKDAHGKTLIALKRLNLKQQQAEDAE